MSEPTLYRIDTMAIAGLSYEDAMLIRSVLVPVESDYTKVWWCKTHENGQTYNDGPWWDEWSSYTCAVKAEYPVEGDCVPVRVTLIGGDE